MKTTIVSILDYLATLRDSGLLPNTLNESLEVVATLLRRATVEMTNRFRLFDTAVSFVNVMARFPDLTVCECEELSILARVILAARSNLTR